MNHITGGLGGQWVWVENHNPEGDLSFNHALNRTDILGPRNIGFKVSGDIFGSNIVKQNSDITVHFNGKICLRNFPDDHRDTLTFRTNNIILEQPIIRPGYAPNVPSEKRRALNFQGSRGVIVRNGSFTWFYDQGVNGWYGATDLWFVRNIIAEGLKPFSGGKYGMAALVGDGKVFWYQNLFAHNKGRNPKFNKGAFWNNLIYNPGDWPVHIDDRFYGAAIADVIGNILIPGPQSNNNANWLVKADNGNLYLYDNITPKRKWYDHEQIKNVVYDNIQVASEPHYDIPFDLIAAKHLEEHLYEVVGPDTRDIVDQRILNSVRTRTGMQLKNESLVGGYPQLV